MGTLYGFKHIGQAYAVSTTEDTCDASYKHQAYRKDQNYVGSWWVLRWGCHPIHKPDGYGNAMKYAREHSSEGCNAPPVIAPIEGCTDLIAGGPQKWWRWDDTNRTGQVKCVFPRPA